MGREPKSGPSIVYHKKSGFTDLHRTVQLDADRATVTLKPRIRMIHISKSATSDSNRASLAYKASAVNLAGSWRGKIPTPDKFYNQCQTTVKKLYSSVLYQVERSASNVEIKCFALI